MGHLLFEDILKQDTTEYNQEPQQDSFNIYKTDDDKRLVFGWASIAMTVDGEQLEDRQKDIIDPEDLEEAAYEYVLNFRDTGEEHIKTMRKKGKLVESCVFTEEKQKAMGIPEGIVPVGWWIGFKIEDDAAWERVKNGTYKMFSIEGKASRMPVQKANPYHGTDGKFTSANGGAIGGLTKQPRAVTAGYTDSENATIINDLLRNNGTERDLRQHKETIDRLDAAMEPIATETKCIRGVSTDFMRQLGLTGEDERKMSFNDLKEYATGKSYTDKGYASCTYGETQNYGSVQLNITAKPGTKAIMTSNDKEKEIILGRDQTYQINGCRMEGHRIVFDVETKPTVAKTFDEILKFNPFHDAKGRFASSSGFATYSANPKTKAGAMAIQRSKAGGHGTTFNSHKESQGENINQNYAWLNGGPGAKQLAAQGLLASQQMKKPAQAAQQPAQQTQAAQTAQQAQTAPSKPAATATQTQQQPQQQPAQQNTAATQAQQAPQQTQQPAKPTVNYDAHGFADYDAAPYHQLYNGKQYYAQQKLTAKQQQAAANYLEANPEPGSLYSHCQNMNYMMATGQKLTGKYKQTHDGMMSAMHNIGYNVELTRYDHADMVNGMLKTLGAGTDYEKMSQKALTKALVGQTVSENKFLSTSYNNFKNAPSSTKSIFDSRAVKITYKTKAATKAMMPGVGSGGDFGEVVLAPTNGKSNKAGTITSVKLTNQMVRRKGTQQYNQRRIEIEIEI